MQSLAENIETIRSNFQETIGIITTLFEVRVDNISIEKLQISQKVSRRGVESYKDKLKSGVNLRPIKVVKHPKEYQYAVLDGNHKAQAHKEMEIPEIKCVIYQDPVGLLYYLTVKGILQPPVAVTDYIRIPLKKVGDNFRNLLMSEASNTSEYHRNPMFIGCIYNFFIIYGTTGLYNSNNPDLSSFVDRIPKWEKAIRS